MAARSRLGSELCGQADRRTAMTQAVLYLMTYRVYPLRYLLDRTGLVACRCHLLQLLDFPAAPCDPQRAAGK
jgi:hypothetical protein